MNRVSLLSSIACTQQTYRCKNSRHSMRLTEDSFTLNYIKERVMLVNNNFIRFVVLYAVFKLYMKMCIFDAQRTYYLPFYNNE